MTDRHVVTVVDADGRPLDRFDVEAGTTLRDALRERGHSPYAALTERLNCGGRGLCGTCGVEVRVVDAEQPNDHGTVGDADPVNDSDGSASPGATRAPEPQYWHDRLAERWGYPRLSCQIPVKDDLRVRIPEKYVWGQLLPRRRDG